MTETLTFMNPEYIRVETYTNSSDTIEMRLIDLKTWIEVRGTGTSRTGLKARLLKELSKKMENENENHN